MRSSEYWRRRAELLTQQIENGEKVPMQRVIRLYKAAFDEIDADIRKIQSTSDAVNKAELAALKRELAEAAAAAPDTARMRAIQNSISAYKFRIDRAELVKQRAYAHLMKAAGRAAAIIKPLLKDTYKAARYGTIDDIASGLDCGVDFSLVPERTINKIIEAPFHGKNYSQRVWDNTAETAGKAQKILTQGMVKGESYSKMARSLSKLCNNTFYNSFRLISTEAAHFTEEGRFDAYNDLGIDKYTYYATLGSKTCDVCGALDGRTFDTSAAREGKNKPPIHPHCRCYTVVGDVKLKSRLARDPVSGKNYKVRGDMTYQEWKNSLTDEQKAAMKQYNKYVDNSGKNGIINYTKEKPEVPQLHYIGKINKEIYSCVTKDIRTDDVIITDERIQHIKERHPNDYERYCEYMKKAVLSPDYIIETHKPYSALVLKSFEEEKRFKTVVRLVTSDDDENYKNSVITFMKINEKEWDRLLRNKKILYKSE